MHVMFQSAESGYEPESLFHKTMSEVPRKGDLVKITLDYVDKVTIITGTVYEVEWQLQQKGVKVMVSLRDVEKKSK